MKWHRHPRPFLPLYDWDRNGESREFSMLGVSWFAMFYRESDDRQGDSNRLSLLGWPRVGTFPTLSLFERVATPSETTPRLFPFYRYNRNDEDETVNWDALLWWHRETEY